MSDAIADATLNDGSALATVRAICDATVGEPSDSELVLGDAASIAPQESCGSARQRIVARTKAARMPAILPLYDKALFLEVGAHPIAKLAL